MKNNIVKVTEVKFRDGSCAETNPIKEFLESINNKLITEFQETINKYQSSEEYLFDYGERTLLGLYANAIIRNDKEYKCITLQEYKVNKGRCDLLLTSKLHDENIDIIFEAKKCTYNGKLYNDDEQKITKTYIDKCFDQGENYFKNEEKWFNNDTYIIVLIFDSINLSIPENLKMQEELMKYNPNKHSPNNKPPKDGIDFYSFFYVEKFSGLGIYGSVRKPNKPLIYVPSF